MDKSDLTQPAKFLKMYICLDDLNKGWKAGCIPIIGFDGCFQRVFVMVNY